MSLLQLEDVSYQYASASEPALQHVNLRLERGVCTAIVGPNGSGKSTLLRQLNGLLRPTVGRVLLDGADTRRLSTARMARRVGLVFQDPDVQLFAGTVLDEVCFGPRNVGLHGAALDAAVAEALESVGLAGLEHVNPYDLGRSQRKLLALAAVLAMQPDVLALDEPITGQDWPGVQRVQTVIQRQVHQGRGVVLVSHEMDVVAETSMHVVVLADGAILLDGSPEEVFAEPNWPLLGAAGLQPPAAAILGAELGLGSTPTAQALLARLDQSRRAV